MVYYIDTSAAAKLVVAELESQALKNWVAANKAELATSTLTTTELFRTVGRLQDPSLMQQAQSVLDACIRISLTESLLEQAGRLAPSGLRSLDAIHLAAAQALVSDLQGFLTYDARQAAAAQFHGIAVAAPS